MLYLFHLSSYPLNKVATGKIKFSLIFQHLYLGDPLPVPLSLQKCAYVLWLSAVILLIMLPSKCKISKVNPGLFSLLIFGGRVVNFGKRAIIIGTINVRNFAFVI